MGADDDVDRAIGHARDDLPRLLVAAEPRQGGHPDREGGEPLGEPVARYGPFVMNTREELVTAVQEFNDGTLVKVGKATL